MKHLPNELLYLLKVYNHITKEIGLDHARSRSGEIREYIKNATFLDAYPTVREYLSEDKSIDDIITYIQRNEKTYSLLGEWKDGEILSILRSKGIDGTISAGDFDLYVDKEGNTYFTLPYKPCIRHKIVLVEADNSGPVHVDDVLWLELYRTKEALCLEMFDLGCNTVKITFSDLECKKLFSDCTSLIEGCKSSFDAVTRISSFIWEKHQYDPSILSDMEKELLPLVRFFLGLDSGDLDTDLEPVLAFMEKCGIEKGARLLGALSECDSDRKKQSLVRKIKRPLRSKSTSPIMKDLCEKLIEAQRSITENQK